MIRVGIYGINSLSAVLLGCNISFGFTFYRSSGAMGYAVAIGGSGCNRISGSALPVNAKQLFQLSDGE